MRAAPRPIGIEIRMPTTDAATGTTYGLGLSILYALVGAVVGFATGVPYWHGLSAFIGAGLVFAGVTDTFQGTASSGVDYEALNTLEAVFPAVQAPLALRPAAGSRGAGAAAGARLPVAARAQLVQRREAISPRQ